MRRRVVAALGAVAIAGAAAPARELGLACLEGFRASYLALDPAQSTVAPESGEPQALSGLIRVEVGSLPLTAATLFEIVRVEARGDDLGPVRLDPTIASAGLGTLFVDRSFLVPTLFLRVPDPRSPDDLPPQDLAVTNVAGTLELDPACGDTVTRLTSSFEVDSLGPAGVLSVTIVATPEPRSGWPGAAAALALLRWRRARQALR